ncbi:MAG: hypothetical protein Q4G68_13855 [Planctomycetia bacterium]|nr:hypothetical protein [Planctomycetia bacterium]
MNNVWEIIVPLLILLLLNLPGIIQAVAKGMKNFKDKAAADASENAPVLERARDERWQGPDVTESGPESEMLVITEVPEVEVLPSVPQQATATPVQARQLVAPTAMYAALLSSPVEAQKAVILAEILRRPEERWQ